ncbi:SMP-30/gluconolactonase/LRE family protein [Luteipulveratus halotolerans]|uniref:SMP-30/gluconolactonase/LRE family protein n=1 Tax=Luteipulveratus halotolerans TaxID=1631356 RepID=UPI000682BB59|nr:SMP-30/gluconolactonase/LRE family protein [Luteipulveratus halotolerans]
MKLAQLGEHIESIIVDRHGRMFMTGYFSGKVYRMDTPQSQPVAITGGINATGGIVVRPDGKLLVGTGNDLLTSATGDLFPHSEVKLVDPDTGAVSVYADGLGGIDGIALAQDGTVYTTTVGGQNIGRVSPDGTVDHDWAKVPIPNGIAVAPDQKSVYVIQSGPAPSLFRIPVDAPQTPQRWVSAGLLDALAVPDGLTLDSAGRPLVTTWTAGQIWRVEGGQFCSIQDGMPLTTQVTYGHGTQGFSAGRRFRAGVNGAIYEVPAGYDAGGR